MFQNLTYLHLRTCFLKGISIWLQESGAIVHASSKMCLDASGLKNRHNVKLSACNGGPYQRWTFEHYNNDVQLPGAL